MIESSEPGICSKKFLSALPHRESGFGDQLEECLKALEQRAKECGLDLSHVLLQTFFLRTEDKKDYYSKKKWAESIMRKYFRSDIPPTSFVAQHPEDGKQVSLDAVLLSNPEAGKIYRKKFEDIAYTAVESPLYTEVYAAGLTNHPDQLYTPAQYREAFDSMDRVLKSEGMDFSHIVRQWNYIEKFLETNSAREGTRQNYQIFNDFRSVFYGETDFPNGYPASTGIGMFTGGAILECLALKPASDISIAPLSNPLQKDAHAYSQDVLEGDSGQGFDKKASPLFERAKIIIQGNSGIIFVSGTAAVRGEDTITEGDIQSQTLATLENIDTLLSAENLLSMGVNAGTDSPRLSQLRAYVKREADLPQVKTICRERYGDIPSQYVVSDVCREALLVEIEGTACVSIHRIQR
jgi:enamine deaminase RidA (YjgF/YER057c/UK114 family)